MKLVEGNFAAKIKDMAKTVETAASIVDEKVDISVHRQKQKLDDVVAQAIKDLNIRFDDNLSSIDLKLKLNND